MGRKESNQTKSTTRLRFNQIVTKIGASVANLQSRAQTYDKESQDIQMVIAATGELDEILKITVIG